MWQARMNRALGFGAIEIQFFNGSEFQSVCGLDGQDSKFECFLWNL